MGKKHYGEHYDQHGGQFVDPHLHFNLSHDHGAPESSDQKPVKTWVGRGLQGDGFHVTIYDEHPFDSMNGDYEIDPPLGIPEGDPTHENYDEGLWRALAHSTRKEGIDFEFLNGWQYDAVTEDFTKEWTTQNIHGGHLNYHINHHFNDDPKWFTITFIYTRAGIAEGGHMVPPKPPYGWHFTTPAIPYIGDLTDDKVGSGVSTIWVNSGTDPNAGTEKQWHSPVKDNAKRPLFGNWYEWLVYPEDPAAIGQIDPPTDRSNVFRFNPSVFNAPASPLKKDSRTRTESLYPWWVDEKDWTVNFEFGKFGNLGVPNWPEISDLTDGMLKKDPDGDGIIIVRPDGPDGEQNIEYPDGNLVRGSYEEKPDGDRDTPVPKEMVPGTIDNIDIGNDAQIDHNKLARIHPGENNIVVQVPGNYPDVEKPHFEYSSLTTDDIKTFMEKATPMMKSVEMFGVTLPVKFEFNAGKDNYVELKGASAANERDVPTSNRNAFFRMWSKNGEPCSTYSAGMRFTLARTTGQRLLSNREGATNLNDVQVEWPAAAKNARNMVATDANKWFEANEKEGWHWEIVGSTAGVSEDIGHHAPGSNPDEVNEFGIDAIANCGPVSGGSPASTSTTPGRQDYICMVNTAEHGSQVTVSVLLYLKRVKN